jgi:hypothetical protein
MACIEACGLCDVALGHSPVGSPHFQNDLRLSVGHVFTLLL